MAEISDRNAVSIRQDAGKPEAKIHLITQHKSCDEVFSDLMISLS